MSDPELNAYIEKVAGHYKLKEKFFNKVNVPVLQVNTRNKFENNLVSIN
jgi:hypothetical protein